MGILSAIPVIGKVVEKGLGVVDQFVEDKDQANKLKHEIKQQIENNSHETDMAQIEGQLGINKAEAKHESLFVAGGRPAIIWICGTALGYQFVLYPILYWVWKILIVFGQVPEGVEPPPTMSMSELMPLLLGLLGLGGMRSYDKRKGTQTDSISRRKSGK